MTGDSIRRVIDGVTVAAALAVVAVLGTGWARRALAHHADASAAARAPSDRSAAPDSSEPLPVLDSLVGARLAELRARYP